MKEKRGVGKSEGKDKMGVMCDKLPCKSVIKFDMYEFLVPLLLRVSYTGFAQFCSASISSTLTDHHY